MEPALFLILHIVNPIQICHTYPTWMKLVTVIPYLKNIQKMYESRDPPPDISIFHFCYIKKYRYRLHFDT